MKKLIISLMVFIVSISVCQARDLEQIRQEGVLRHIGVKYANFVSGMETGLSVDVIKLFAKHLGVKYEFVQSSWPDVISDLVGQDIRFDGKAVIRGQKMSSRGDLIANGLTILPWRQQVLDFSEPTFITQIWLIAPASSALLPITPVSEPQDIIATSSLLVGQRLMGKKDTCLDPRLYPLNQSAFTTVYFDGNLNDIAPAVVEGAADLALLDVPDALLALSRWPGEVKILGPLSEKQYMGVGFSKDSVELRQEFDRFFRQLKQDGIYAGLVRNYYPSVFQYYQDFFEFK